MKIKVLHVKAMPQTAELVKIAMKNVPSVLINTKNVPRSTKSSVQMFDTRSNWNVCVLNGAEFVNRRTDDEEQSTNIQEISTLEILTLSNSLLPSPTNSISYDS